MRVTDVLGDLVHAELNDAAVTRMAARVVALIPDHEKDAVLRLLVEGELRKRLES